MIVHNHIQNSPEWHAARIGLPTASSAKLLVTSKGEPTKGESITTYAKKLAIDKFAGKSVDSWQGNKYTEFGHEHEDHARKWYAFTFDQDPIDVGFCVHDDGKSGASPDGLVNSHGLLEIKCLPVGHADHILHIEKFGKIKADHMAQIQMQLYVTGRHWCHLVHWHPDLPNLCIKVDADAEFHKTLASQIDVVVKKRDEFIERLEKLAQAENIFE